MTPALVFMVLGAKILSVVLCGLFVRVQLAVHRGFDLSLAAIIAVCADAFIFSWNGLADGISGPVAIAVALTIAVAIGSAAGTVWNAILRRLVRRAREPGYVVFLASLGLSTLGAGIIGMLRGPGLKVMDVTRFTAPGSIIGELLSPLTACVLLASAGIAAAAWARSRSGFAISLLAQDRAFAIEIGIDPGRIGSTVGAVWGGILAAVACASGVLAGNTPEGGLSFFLLGAAAALLLPNIALLGPVIGGTCIGVALVVGQFVMPPSWVEPAVFAAMLVFLAFRGVDRVALGLR